MFVYVSYPYVVSLSRMLNKYVIWNFYFLKMSKSVVTKVLHFTQALLLLRSRKSLISSWHFSGNKLTSQCLFIEGPYRQSPPLHPVHLSPITPKEKSNLKEICSRNIFLLEYLLVNIPNPFAFVFAVYVYPAAIYRDTLSNAKHSEHYVCDIMLCLCFIGKVIIIVFASEAEKENQDIHISFSSN